MQPFMHLTIVSIWPRQKQRIEIAEWFQALKKIKKSQAAFKNS
jgi:hypothetical protein